MKRKQDFQKMKIISMPNYKATLTGKGNINNCIIYLEVLPAPDNEFPMPIFLTYKATAKRKWFNNDISIDVNGKLDFELRVHAFHGTGWDFKLVNTDNASDVISLSGSTGDDPDIGWNISVIKGSVDPHGDTTENSFL